MKNINLILSCIFLIIVICSSMNCDLFEMPENNDGNNNPDSSSSLSSSSSSSLSSVSLSSSTSSSVSSDASTSSSESSIDTENPVLNNITVSPSTLNGPGSVKVMIDAVDAGSGISYISIDYYSPLYLADNTGHHFSVSNFIYNSGSGYWEAECEFKNYYETGSWKIKYIGLNDNAGNYVSYMINTAYSMNNYVYFNGSGITDSGIPVNNSSVELSGTTPDITAPALNSITVIPNVINAAGGIVTIQLSITENGTGIQSINLSYFSPTRLSGNYSGQTISVYNFIYNSTLSLWEASCTLQSSHEAGIWKIDNISIYDKAENYSRYYIDTDVSTANYAFYNNNSLPAQTSGILINSSSLTKNE